MSAIKLIAGLANPGADYAETRHNAGAWYLQRLAQQHRIVLKPLPCFCAQVGQLQLGDHTIALLIPSTFMNLSGDAVAKFSHFYRIQPQEILIAHDDLDLNVGSIKYKLGGSPAGHNGLKDIINKLQRCREFYRLRIGIGHPGSKDQVVSFVLGRPPPAERELIDQAIDRALQATDLLLQQGVTQAMQFLHRMKTAPPRLC